MTTTERRFIDTNVLVYLVSNDARKTPQAEQIVSAGPVLSIQVHNEFVAIARRKLDLPWDEISAVLDLAGWHCETIPNTLDIHMRALTIAREANIHIYDANIVAAAEHAGCSVLLTEDLNHGQKFGSVTIRNPFAET